jgi:hypothetical protein
LRRKVAGNFLRLERETGSAFCEGPENSPIRARMALLVFCQHRCCDVYDDASERSLDRFGSKMKLYAAGSLRQERSPTVVSKRLI